MRWLTTLLLPLTIAAQTGRVTTVSAASFAAGSPVAPDSIASAFGQGLATLTQAATTLPLPAELGGTRVGVTDSRSVERAAPLFFVSPGQVNFLIPGDTAAGTATVTVRSGNGAVSTGSVEVRATAPGLFTAAGSGRGVAAAQALRVRADGSRSLSLVFRGTVAEPIDLGAEGDQLYLLLAGTGIRGFRQGVTVTVGGTNVPVLAALAQGQFPGLDQVNAGPLPRSLAGRGEVEVVVAADGVRANGATVALGLKPPTAGQWGTRAALPEPNSEMGVAEVDGKIYVIGGYPSNRISVASVQVYDPATDTWRLTAPLPRALNHPMPAAAGGKLYVIGGQATAQGDYLDTVYEYDPATEAWRTRARMPTQRSSGAAAVVDGRSTWPGDARRVALTSRSTTLGLIPGQYCPTFPSNATTWARWPSAARST